MMYDYARYIVDDKPVMFFNMGDGVQVVYSHGHKTLHKTRMQQAISAVRLGWQIAGLHPTREVYEYRNHTWKSRYFETMFTHKALVYYWKQYGVSDFDGAHVYTWLVHADKPLKEIRGAFSGMRISDGFAEAVVEGLHGDGFQWRTPLSSYSPTGKPFVSTKIHALPNSRRIIVENEWMRDV